MTITPTQMNDLRWRINRARRDGRATDAEVFDATVAATVALLEGGSIEDIQRAIDQHVLITAGPQRQFYSD